MSAYDRSMESLNCAGCGERQAMRTIAIHNPYMFVAAVEKFELEHKLCRTFKTRQKAQQALRWARAMKAAKQELRTIRLGVIAQKILARRPGSWIRANV